MDPDSIINNNNNNNNKQTKTNKRKESFASIPCVAVEVMGTGKEGRIEEATVLETALLISLADEVTCR